MGIYVFIIHWKPYLSFVRKSPVLGLYSIEPSSARKSCKCQCVKSERPAANRRCQFWQSVLLNETVVIIGCFSHHTTLTIEVSLLHRHLSFSGHVNSVVGGSNRWEMFFFFLLNCWAQKTTALVTRRTETPRCICLVAQQGWTSAPAGLWRAFV